MECGASPAQLLYGRSLKDRIPIAKQKLIPKLPDHDKVRAHMKEEKKKQKKNYDDRHRVKEREELKNGDKVWIVNMQREGVIENRAAQPRSYMVRTDDNIVRRNRRHLQPIPDVTAQENENDVLFEEVHTREKRKRNTRAPRRLCL